MDLWTIWEFIPISSPLFRNHLPFWAYKGFQSCLRSISPYYHGGPKYCDSNFFCCIKTVISVQTLVLSAWMLPFSVGTAGLNRRKVNTRYTQIRLLAIPDNTSFQYLRRDKFWTISLSVSTLQFSTLWIIVGFTQKI